MTCPFAVLALGTDRPVAQQVREGVGEERVSVSVRLAAPLLARTRQGWRCWQYCRTLSTSIRNAALVASRATRRQGGQVRFTLQQVAGPSSKDTQHTAARVRSTRRYPPVPALPGPQIHSTGPRPAARVLRLGNRGWRVPCRVPWWGPRRVTMTGTAPGGGSAARPVRYPHRPPIKGVRSVGPPRRAARGEHSGIVHAATPLHSTPLRSALLEPGWRSGAAGQRSALEQEGAEAVATPPRQS